MLCLCRPRLERGAKAIIPVSCPRTLLWASSLLAGEQEASAPAALQQTDTRVRCETFRSPRLPSCLTHQAESQSPGPSPGGEEPDAQRCRWVGRSRPRSPPAWHHQPPALRSPRLLPEMPRAGQRPLPLTSRLASVSCARLSPLKRQKAAIKFILGLKKMVEEL